jgi:hypothetical protein
MKMFRRNSCVSAASILIVVALAACGLPPVTPSTADLLMESPPQSDVTCEACAQATLAVEMTQMKNNADNQAAATAEIMRANAQATLNSANTTLSVALTQDQNNADVIAAQIAATAEFERANAQATINSAGSTQSAALTQDAIRQTQMADLATTGAQSSLIQQNKDELAASTQTAIANNIATQTQAAAATSQWYTDQERQRAEQRQGPIAFLWMWCFPMFIVLLAVLVVWGFWRWLKIQQANQRILVNPVDQLPAGVVDPRHGDSLPYLNTDVVDSGYQVTTPDDQVHQWLDEVKDELRDSDKKDEDNNDADNRSTPF